MAGVVLNLPLLAVLGIGLTGILQQNRFADPSTSQRCNTAECVPMWKAIHVDRAVNTTLRDDTLGGPTLKGAYEYVKGQYRREAQTNPGVNLVRHAIP